MLGSCVPQCRGPGATFRDISLLSRFGCLGLNSGWACWAESILKRISQAQIISEFNLVFCLPVELATKSNCICFSFGWTRLPLPHIPALLPCPHFRLTNWHRRTTLALYCPLLLQCAGSRLISLNSFFLFFMNSF